MAHIVCYEVFPNGRNVNMMRWFLVKRHGFKERENHVGPYFYIEVNSADAWMTRYLLQIRGYKFRSFDKRYERSGSYRKTFFEHNKGPYHCAYCGKRLRADDLEVDHLVPVAKAKSEVSVRTWLHICGITNVNNPRNLVASCEKCNRKKSDKMGRWIIRGALGRYKIFWTIRNIILTIVMIIAGVILYSNIAVIKNIIEFIQRAIESIA